MCRLATRNYRYDILIYESWNMGILLMHASIAIEVMASKETRPDIIALLMAQCKAHGFSPFHVKKDSNGYIYNRYIDHSSSSLIFSLHGINMQTSAIGKLIKHSGSGQQSSVRLCSSSQKELPPQRK